jgi:hypothetical protein
MVLLLPRPLYNDDDDETTESVLLVLPLILLLLLLLLLAALLLLRCPATGVRVDPPGRALARVLPTPTPRLLWAIALFVRFFLCLLFLLVVVEINKQ